MEPPAHALLEGLDLRQRRSRNHHQPDVSRRKMHQAAVDMVRNERAARAAFLPVRTEHEVIHNQLAPAAEKLGQRFLAFRPIEHVWLLYLLPGQLPALLAQLITQPRELLLLLQQLLA